MKQHRSEQMTHQHICITGASRGLGKALAIALSTHNTTLTLCSRDLSKLKDTELACQAKGANTTIEDFDLRDSAQLTKTLIQIDQKKPIDFLILNAGISQQTQGFSDDFSIIETNLSANILSIQTLLPAMLKRKSSRIMVISSLVAFVPTLPSANAYHISKHALRDYTYALAQRYRNSSVNIQCVCPGFISTQMTQQHRFPMPGLLSTQKAAEKILKASKKNKTIITFPYLLHCLIYLLRLLPKTWVAQLDLKLN